MKNELWKHSYDDTGSSEEAELTFHKVLQHRWGWDAVAVASSCWSLWWDTQTFICRKPVHCEPLFSSSCQRILPLAQGMKRLSSLDFRKLNEKLRSCLVWGFCHIISTGDSRWWGFVSVVPKCTQAKMLFALVEISQPPNRNKLHKCKSQLAVPCWFMSLPMAGGVGLDDL